MNDLDPSVTIVGDSALIAWARDNSFIDGAEYNLTTHLAVYDRVSGAEVTAPHQVRVYVGDSTTPAEARGSEPDGDESIGNFWMVDLATLPTGEALLAGSWGDPERSTFRVYLQHLSATGAPIGSAWLPDPEGANQAYPNLSVSAYGVIDASWTGDDASGMSGMFRRSQRGDVAGELYAYVNLDWVELHTMRSPHLSYEEGLLAGAPRGDDLGQPWVIGGKNAGGFTLIDGEGGERGLSPRRAFRSMRFIPRGLVGYQQISGYEHEVWWRPLNEDASWGDTTTLSGETPAAPYPLSVTLFSGGVLLVWAEGYNPSFKLRASLITTPTP